MRHCACGPILCLLLLFGCAAPLFAQDHAVAESYAPSRYGVGLLMGTTYDPQQIGLVIVQGVLLVDYDHVFRHAAPEALRLKFEANAGLASDGRQRGLLALNMLALYYLRTFQQSGWAPYVEAGIGMIYTDFRVKGQGLNFNFNPQAGIGIEQALKGRSALTLALRLHHISNGHLYHENRGLNSVLLQIGYLF